jgi:hypothetical protein
MVKKMSLTCTVLGLFFITLTMGCAHAAPASSRGTDLRVSKERCALPLMNTQEVVIAILRDLPRFYTAVNGTIIKVENVETGRWEVWVSQNEAIHVVAFDGFASPTCEVTLRRAGERAINRDARNPE